MAMTSARWIFIPCGLKSVLCRKTACFLTASVHSNIALTRPDASFEEVQEAAKLACAHEFIETLPAGYSSNVGERGKLERRPTPAPSDRSDILRRPSCWCPWGRTSALMWIPSVVWTSELDALHKDRTVFFITHRLISLSQADTILVMNQGALVEQGTHAELMDLGGRYSTLYQQQEANPFQLSLGGALRRNSGCRNSRETARRNQCQPQLLRRFQAKIQLLLQRLRASQRFAG